MANNTFVTLTVPDSPGVGPAASIVQLAPSPSLVVNGPAADRNTRLVIEASTDGAHFAPVTSIFPINNPPATTLDGLVAISVRVRRFSGSGPAFVALGSASTSANTYAPPLSFNAADTSNMGPFKTIIVTGTYVKAVVIEGSTDGTNYDAIAIFNTGGAGVAYVYGTWQTMRVRVGSDLPESVSVGAGFPAGAAVGVFVRAITPGTAIEVFPPFGTGVVDVSVVMGDDIQSVGTTNFPGVEDAAARADHIHAAGPGSILQTTLTISTEAFPDPGDVIPFPFPDSIPSSALFFSCVITVDETMTDGDDNEFDLSVGYGNAGVGTNTFFATRTNVSTVLHPQPFLGTPNGALVGMPINDIVPMAYIYEVAGNPTSGVVSITLYYLNV